MILKIRYILTIVVVINIQSLMAQVNADNFPTQNIPINLVIKNDTIAAYAMLAKGKEKKETVILTHGLPGHERNLDIAQELRRSGKNVIYFNYRGAWGSQGDFLYSNCIEDVQKLIDYLSTPENSIKYRVKPNGFSLLGHSMGGGIALIAGAKDDRVKKIAVYSPFLVDGATEQSLNSMKNYLLSLFMLNIDFESFKKDVIANKEKFSVLKYKEALAKKKLLIFDENERNKSWINQLKNAEYILIKTDHSFSDKRLELTAKIKNHL